MFPVLAKHFDRNYGSAAQDYTDVVHRQSDGNICAYLRRKSACSSNFMSRKRTKDS